MTTGPTSASLLLGAIRRHGSRTALIVGGQTLTYADLDASSDRLAGYLKHRGLGRGSRVALHLRNSAEYVISELASSFSSHHLC